jgi:hypothetical protein
MEKNGGMGKLKLLIKTQKTKPLTTSVAYPKATSDQTSIMTE